MAAILEVKNLHTRYGKVEAVHGVSLAVQAPLIVKEIFRIISDLRKTGVATLLIEQNARAALQVSDYGYVIEMGEITMHRNASDLAHDKRVIDSYLGLAKKAA